MHLILYGLLRVSDLIYLLLAGLFPLLVSLSIRYFGSGWCPMCLHCRTAAFRNLKTMSECLADEIMNCAKESSNSYAIKKKDEIERVAKANRWVTRPQPMGQVSPYTTLVHQQFPCVAVGPAALFAGSAEELTQPLRVHRHLHLLLARALPIISFLRECSTDPTM